MDQGNYIRAVARRGRLRAGRTAAAGYPQPRHTSRRSGVSKALDPQQDLRRFEAEARRTGDVASRQRYADELVRQKRAPEAVEIYRQALTGLYQPDPNLMLGLARAQFASGAFARRGRRWMHSSPAIRSSGPRTATAVCARAGSRRQSRPGARGVCRGRQLLCGGGGAAALRADAAHRRQNRGMRKVLKELLEHARLAPRHYRKMQQQWLSMPSASCPRSKLQPPVRPQRTGDASSRLPAAAA